MNMFFDRLKNYGADLDGAMGRFLNDEELYASCFAEFMNDPCFAELKNALDAHDYDAAFDAAHTLKGVAGNMGLTPMYRAVCDIVEPLRAKQVSDLQPLYEEIMRQHTILKQLEL
ncbi:MAG: Hpt domain-containing protein [Christensenella sp.]|nr:Hpt domain-containing protein [Christensenella sp.]